MNIRQVRRSFTLVELIIVITIIGILATSMLSALYTTIDDAKEARTRVQIARIHSLLMEKWESYQTRALPINMGVLRGLPINGEVFTDTNGNGDHDSGEPFVDANANNSFDNAGVSRYRRLALLELMRMELPDRKSDLEDLPLRPTYGLNPPAVWNRTTPPSLWIAYRRLAKFPPLTSAQLNPANWPVPPIAAPPPNPLPDWKQTHQGSECLYFILSQIRDGDSSALDFLMPSEIGDVDEDGYREILDGWGRPIEFLRWPTGFATLPGPDGAWGKAGVDDDNDQTIDNETEMGSQGSDDRTELMDRDPLQAQDLLNPTQAIPTGFAIFPLVFSAGRDGEYHIFSDLQDGRQVNPSPTPPSYPLRYVNAAPALNPYAAFTDTSGKALQVGRPIGPGANDNITNHSISGTGP